MRFCARGLSVILGSFLAALVVLLEVRANEVVEIKKTRNRKINSLGRRVIWVTKPATGTENALGHR